MSDRKKEWHITVDVTRVNGYQVWRVEAETEEQARAQYEAGNGDIVMEEVEVTSLSDTYSCEEFAQ